VAELACLTGRPGGATEILPALEYLAHPVATLPLDGSSLDAAASRDLVVVDATRDLSRAQALCRRLRAAGDHVAILVVMPEAGLAGFQRDWGASDFVLPTAGPAEVEARIRLLAQRPDATSPDDAIRVGELVVDPVSYQVRLRGRPLDLTYKEFELLRFLAARPGRVSTRAQLLQEVWGYDFFGGIRPWDVHSHLLRAKLGAEHESMIATIRGVGYKLLPADQARAEREASS
jgi:DNA-binding response OmpR family regulator